MMRFLFQLPIYMYRWCISPFLPRMCRFQPSCSEYGLEALAQHGVWRGGILTARRLLRCHPWGGEGFDPVPSKPAGRDVGSSHACPDKGCTSPASDLNSQHTHSFR